MNRHDSQAIWDAAAEAGRVREMERKASDLRRKIRSVECGDCDLWMKSSMCPRERNVNGWNRGPSMSDPICHQFELKDSSERARARWQSELDDLEARVKGAQDEA